MIEDNRADVFLIREAIERSGVRSAVVWLDDGQKAIEYIAGEHIDESEPAPDLILLDLSLPKRGGQEVLACIRESRRCALTPVLIVSSSDSEKDRADTATGGANAYFRKPSSYAGFMKLGDEIKALLEPATTRNGNR